MKDIKSKNPEFLSTNKNNKKQKDKKTIEENKDFNNELSKYKQSFYIIKKTINIIKNHYYNKINNIDTLRIREKKKLCYLKRKNVILEDKNIKSEVEIPKNTENILKLREEQIERLSVQIDSLNELYHKQVDNNKKLISELEELNKSVLYLNNKIQEERNSREQMKKKLRFYKRYNRNKKKFKLNFDVLNINKDDIKEMKDDEKEKEDICISILCLLKTELEIIDDENKKKREEDDEEKEKLKVKSNNFFKKLFGSNYKHKKLGLLENISKKQFFSFYEKAFTENNKIKFDKKQFFFFPSNIKKKKMNKKYHHIHNELKYNIHMKEIQKKEKNNNDNKNSKWNYLTMNNIYFYNNFNDNFDEEPDHKFCDNNKNYEGRNSIDDYVFFKKYNNINSDHIVFTNMIENNTKMREDGSNNINEEEKKK
ncbi:hypothetical protein PFFVO_03739 [Plasmodium falciparum Vietnam Oak-Knoll (FVO)]|uniref:Uncharacterized protein n=1 Tax=Plasmodium falciparum Vietnam Oak-Knoll (FVO) TaxID=1036723 RepID=A0A024V3E4_PLAFA|nr:hypothetical protein PFFVO_03739 [Plasmodium falciparum Vietnam Oak-Knoll (FVO)]